ncbi:MAG: hypothetical protein M3304_08930 [Actinomycetota bacterium]|nr:hypothetical protein [Actinomycetota bacterium]
MREITPPEDEDSSEAVDAERACCATQRPSGCEVEATYSIRRVAGEIKKSTDAAAGLKRADGARRPWPADALPDP